MAKKEPKLRVETRVPKSIRDQIDQLAYKEGRTRAAYLSVLIMKDLELKKTVQG
jgi:predicted DNA-binding protein